MRLLSKPLNSIWWLIAGQTIIGIASSLTTGGVSIIANYWFADNERAKATSFMMMSNPFGIFVSFFIQVLYSLSINDKIRKNGG
jgi:MFS family permease